LRASGISLKTWQQIIALLGLVLAFNVASGLIFALFPVRIKMSKRLQADSPPIAPIEDNVQWDVKNWPAVVISLKQYSLNVQMVRPWGTVRRQTSILKPFSTTFEQGKLNLIM
jgi:hypothetical protein